jgi:hypothetical protein
MAALVCCARIKNVARPAVPECFFSVPSQNLSEPNRSDGVMAAPGRGCTHVRFCEARSRAVAGSAGHCGRPYGSHRQFRFRSICRLGQQKNGPDGSSNRVRAASDLGSADPETVSVCECVPLCAGTSPTIELLGNRSVMRGKIVSAAALARKHFGAPPSDVRKRRRPSEVR